MTRSDSQEPSGSKRPRLTLKERRAKDKEKKKDMKEQEEAELDARREEAEAWERQQVVDQDLNPLLLSREDR